MSEKNCILVIDDDEGQRKSLTLLLKKKGYLVESAATGKEALAIAQGRLINVTLLDVKLPDIMGTELLAPLKQTNPDMSVIMITGFASVENAVQSLTAGASGYITKPIDLDGMLEKIKTALDQQHLVTEVHRANEALRESEKKFHTVADFTYDWELWLGLDRQIIYCSPSCERITGYSPEAFIADPQLLMKIVHPDDLILMEEHNRTALEAQESWSVDFRIIHLDGSVRWIGQACQQVTAGDGTLLGRRVSNRDITERKKAEDALRESEEKFRGIFDTINDGIHIHEIEPDGKPGKFIEVNEVACRMLQYTREKLLGLGPLDIVSGYHSRPFDEIIGELSTTGHAIFETGHRRKDGTIVPVEINAHVVNLQGKRVTVSVIRDITERKQAEDALSISLAKYKVLFESFPLAITISDKMGNIVESNRRADEILGLSPIEQSLRKIDGTEWQLIRSDGTPMPSDEYASVRALKENCLVQNVEMGIVKGNSAVTWINVTAAPIPLKDHGVAITYSDITDRKLMESEIRSLNTVLEQRVKERTEALSKTNIALEEENAQRLEAEGKLQASHDEKVLLLKEIHHRVKNNLQIIVSLLRLQKRLIVDTATQQQILDSESRIRSMALVHEKLYRSTDFASIDFEDYLKTLVNQLVPLYTTNPGQIRIVIDMKGISVDINQSIPLGLIMNELISNTMKYAFPEGRTGEFSIRGMQQGGSKVFTVRDNGIGMPPGFDWHETKSLGMHLVIMLTDQLKGTIELEKGEGTSFRLTLPEKT